MAYADDTAFLFTGKTWSETKKKVEDSFVSVKYVLDNFKLSMNDEKTAISITEANRPNYSLIKIDGLDEPIRKVHSIKYLMFNG